MTLIAKRVGLAVLLVYGVEIPVARNGQPGFRLTVQCDGAVWVQPVGFHSTAEADLAQCWVQANCLSLGLAVEPLPAPPAVRPGLVVRRREEAP